MMSLLQSFIALTTPIYLAAFVGELCLGRFRLIKVRYGLKDTAVSLAMGIGAGVVGALTAALSLSASRWVYEHRVFTIHMGWGLAWVALFLLDDLTYYWFHRISHERRLWWAAHVNHHSSEHFNYSTALRQTWTGKPIGTWAFWLPLAFLGFPPEVIATQTALNLFYQFWLHTEAVGKLPAWIEAVLNTPSHHRVHHARDPIYLDRNYGGILIIWDRLFGTFQDELPDVPCQYGLTRNIGTYNILRVAFHEWAGIVRDVTRGPRHLPAWILGRPGWRPEGTQDVAATSLKSPVVLARSEGAR